MAQLMSNTESPYVLPLSNDSKLANVSISRAKRSANLFDGNRENKYSHRKFRITYFHNNFPLAEASKLRHAEPRLNAALAALTATSISALSPSATNASVLPVAGLKVVNFLPDTASTN